jgi:hypothetical protein
MLTAEDRELLGIIPEISKAPPADFLQFLRAIDHDIDRRSRNWDVSSVCDGSHFQILVASNREERRRAYALAHRLYLGHSYVSASDGVIVFPYDADEETITLLARDESGRDVATITLAFDSASGLPCDEIYGAELNELRAQGRRLVEVTRFAIDEQHEHSKTLLVHLFNFIYVYARRIKGCDDFVIEVNPRHVNYYRRLLKFAPAGPERACPRVQGAPAVLLRLDLVVPEREARRARGKSLAADERTLYPHFYSWLEEGAVAEFLARSHRPMSDDDAVYFGLI